MGFIDKAKDAIGNAVDKLKDPDQSLVEKTWPLGQPDDEHLPSDPAEASEPEEEQGIDPDLDGSTDDQYSQEDQEL